MKRILLASASMVAFAGAAAAEISFTGTAILGYNDTVNASDDNHYGFYWEADVAVTMSQALDNGITASATFNFEAADENNGQDLIATDYLLSLTSDMGGLYYGDTAFAAQTYWAAAGDMEADGFSENDGETVLRGEVMFGGVTAGMSYVIADAGGDILGNNSAADSVDQMSLGATGSFGNFNFALAYQEAGLGTVGAYNPAGENGDFNNNEIFGISAGGSFAGADVTVAYATNNTAGIDSLGIKVAYPVGPVTVTAYYVAEGADLGTDPDDNYGINVAYANGPIAVALDYQDDQGTTKIALDGSYDVGNGVMVYAGAYFQDNLSGVDYEDEFYLAASYDLGGGASVLASYATGEDNADDEIGAGDYQEGLTLEASFSF